MPEPFGRSPILDLLGPDGYTALPAVMIPGTIVWFNFELARELGIQIPPSNVMTPQLHHQLVTMFSLRALRNGETLDGRRRVSLYADHYGGSDIQPCLGAGRSGFLAQGNFYLKGIGLTPLYRQHRDDDFQHTHGGFALRECMFEAIFGEVNAHLLSKGSARILAIVDQGDFTVYPDGMRERRGVAVRAGVQLRPAHLFGSGVKGRNARLELFLRIVGATGQLVTRRTRASAVARPDLAATMLRIVDDHATTAAELYRWRMLHGAISMSNMEMNGAMLDTTTQSAQPRTAPLKILTYHSDANIVYGKEHLQRADELAIMYRSIVRTIPASNRAALNAVPVDIAAAMARAYEKHLELRMLTAIGLTADVAARIHADWPRRAARVTKVLLKMATLRNRDSVNANQVTGAHTAVLDVFQLLAEAPVLFLTAPPTGVERHLRECLRPVYRGTPSARSRMRSCVDMLVKQFGTAYADLMAACHRVAPEYYGSAGEMHQSIAARARFENRPLSELYRCHILRELRDAAAEYVRTGDAELISRTVSERILASRRSVDALLRRGRLRRHGGRQTELQQQTIDGITYSVLASSGGPQLLWQLRVTLPLEVAGCNHKMTFSYRYTTGDGRSAREVSGRIERGRRGPVIAFCIPDITSSGELRGTFHTAAGPLRLRPSTGHMPYAYVIPSAHEFVMLWREHRERVQVPQPSVKRPTTLRRSD